MTSFLLIISFLLHIILLTAVFQLYQQLQKTKKETNDEIEAALLAFLEDIKIENEQLRTMLSQTGDKSTKRVVQKKPLQTEETRERINKTEDDVEESILPIDSLLKSHHDVVEQTVESKIISMYEQGLSIEEIAKQLHRGKTEVALIVKMYQK